MYGDLPSISHIWTVTESYKYTELTYMENKKKKKLSTKLLDYLIKFQIDA